MYGPNLGEWAGVLLIIAALGAGAFEGCRLGCSYVANKVEFKWK
jgi:hypothetical protein